MRSWQGLLLFTGLAACAGAWAADDGKISLFLECSRDTPSSAEFWLLNGSVDHGGPSKICADRAHSVTRIYVESIDLREAPSLGTYALFVGVDKKRSGELYSFSSANLGKIIITEKGGRFISEAMMGAPIRNGVIFFSAPDKESGEKLGNLIFGAPGKPSS